MVRGTMIVTVLLVMLIGLASAMAPLDTETVLSQKSSEELTSLKKEKTSLMLELENLKRINENIRRSYALRDYENGTHWRPLDCADILLGGETKSGVYAIYPFSCGCGKPIMVYCDMETDGGGWTLILNREEQTSQENFNRTWQEYKDGFGSLSGEHWLGNEIIHALTNSRSYAFRMDLLSPGGSEYHILYDNIRIEDENNRYKLYLGTRMSESTISNDCYTYNRFDFFSTYDSGSYRSCAKAGGGGFWFSSSCHIKYPPTGIWGTNFMNTTCYYNTNYQATNLQMKIRPSACESTYKKISFPGGFNCRSECAGPIFLNHD